MCVPRLINRLRFIVISIIIFTVRMQLLLIMFLHSSSSSLGGSYRIGSGCRKIGMGAACVRNPELLYQMLSQKCFRADPLGGATILQHTTQKLSIWSHLKPYAATGGTMCVLIVSTCAAVVRELL